MPRRGRRKLVGPKKVSGFIARARGIPNREKKLLKEG